MPSNYHNNRPGGGRQWNGGNRRFPPRDVRGDRHGGHGNRHSDDDDQGGSHTGVTRDLKTLLGEELFPRCESPSLRLDKFVTIGSKMKLREIANVVELHNRGRYKVETFVPRIGFQPFVVTLRSNLIINQAGGILENAGISLHPHFNVPFLPGSAVKGVARHAAWCEWKAETDESRKKDIAERIAATFGYPTQADDLDKALEKAGCAKQSGSVAFMAAYPCDANGNAAPASLAVDILTPHGGNDWTDPVPNPFPVVKKGTSFKLVVGPAKVDAEKRVGDAIQWLKKGLMEGGLGA